MQHLGRHNINPEKMYRQRKLVLLSYTWDLSAGEDEKAGHHYVQERDSEDFFESTLRNVVWERASAYMEYCENELLSGQIVQADKHTGLLKFRPRISHKMT